MKAEDATQRSRDLVIAFDACAQQCLEARLVRPAQTTIAGILGIPSSTYANLLAGRQRLTIDVLVVWLDRWRSAGWPELIIVADHQRTQVRRKAELFDQLRRQMEMGRSTLPFNMAAMLPVGED